MHYKDAKQIVSATNGMNLSRGCVHGCIYCDSRSHCYQMLHDFEDVEIKGNAAELLEQTLRRRRNPCMIGTGSMSDPYQPIPQVRALTQECLQLLHRYGFGATLITKSNAVRQDLPLLAAINQKTKAVVQMTLTTWDDALSKTLEPNVCTTRQRVEILQECKALGIPTVVWLSPILPFLNDTQENISAILNACFEADVKGIICFGMGLTLRQGNREYFYQKLDEHFPGVKQRYINAFGNAYQCISPNNAALMRYFHAECKRNGVLHTPDAVFGYLHDFEDANENEQLSLF